MSFTAALRDLNKLNTFVRVAQRRSFTHAAAELRTRPSVVSKRMKELERTLGFRLINRSTHGLVLTGAGEGLFQHCLQMLARLDDYVVERRNLDTGPFGTLRVQATSDYARLVLAPFAAQFVTNRPGESGRPKSPQDLGGHNCLVNPSSRPKSWPFQNSPRPLLVEVKGSLSSNSNDVLIQMALHHCGIIRVPVDTVKTEIAEEKLEA